MAEVKKVPKQSRGWCFTVNNWTDDDLAWLMAMCEENEDIKYMVIGFEIGGRCQTPHLQSFVLFVKRHTFKVIADLFEPNHVEPQKGSKVQAIYYCRKDGDFWEYGERPRQGKRTDLDLIAQDIKDGVPMHDIANKYPSQYYFHHRGFKAYAEMLAPKHQTKLFFYYATKPDSIQLMMAMKNSQDLLVEIDELYPHVVLIKYFSGQYRHIYYPLGLFNSMVIPALFRDIEVTHL